MDAKVNQINGVYTVQLTGHLDFETADALKVSCEKHFVHKKVVFDLKGLSFVGSSGITPFLQTLGFLLRRNGNQLKVCSVSAEFMKIFEAAQLVGLEVYEDEYQARLAFDHPPFPQIPATTFAAPVAAPVAGDSEVDH